MFYLFPRAVKPSFCEQIVRDCKQNILEEATVLNLNKSSRDDPDNRKTSIHFITDENNKINALVWDFLREANKTQFNYDLTYFHPIQFGEYKDGGFYGWHQDEGGIDKSNNEVRKLSLSLILSDPDTFSGGELQFYNGDKPFNNMGEITGEQITNDLKAQGSVVVFDSRDWHRVTPVTKGVRHSIVCWTVGPNFK